MYCTHTSLLWEHTQKQTALVVQTYTQKLASLYSHILPYDLTVLLLIPQSINHPFYLLINPFLCQTCFVYLYTLCLLWHICLYAWWFYTKVILSMSKSMQTCSLKHKGTKYTVVCNFALLEWQLPWLFKYTLILQVSCFWVCFHNKMKNMLLHTKISAFVQYYSYHSLLSFCHSCSNTTSTGFPPICRASLLQHTKKLTVKSQQLMQEG